MKTFIRSTSILLASISSLLLFTGCGGKGTSYSILPTGQSFTQSTSAVNNQLDILWVVDNSASMSPLQQNMVNNFNSFITNFQSKGYDFKISVTTTEAYLADTKLSGYNSFYAPYAQFKDGITGQANDTNVFVITPKTPNLVNTFVTNASLGAGGDGDERAFSSFKTALNSSLNTGFLRPTSFFAVIILSDEDDFSSESRVQDSMSYPTNNASYVPDHDYAYSGLDSVASYETYLDTLTQTTGSSRRWSVSTIAVLDSTCLASHSQQSSSTIIGQRYIQIANDSAGTTGSVCDTSYATSLNAIQNQIATLSTQFFLNKVPQVSSIVVTVNGLAVIQDPANGWTYNSSGNSIQFHGTAVPPQGAAVNVNFVPANINT